MPSRSTAASTVFTGVGSYREVSLDNEYRSARSVVLAVEVDACCRSGSSCGLAARHGVTERSNAATEERLKSATRQAA